MSIEIFNDAQGSPEWFARRMGRLTASEFKKVMVKKGRGEGGESAQRKTLLYKLAGEAVTGRPKTEYTNEHMDRGSANEGEARDLYAFTHGIEPQRVGFVWNPDLGCGASPDSLIGADGGLEIKDAEPHIQIERLEKGKLPSEHVAQVQGGIFVCERDWWDFMSHCRGIKPLVIRVYRDDLYIRDLTEQVTLFNEELAALIERLRHGDLSAAA